MHPTTTDQITETIYSLGVGATTATAVVEEIVHIIETHHGEHHD